ALDFITSISEETIRDLFRLAFGSIMVNVSNYSYEPSLTRRASVGKPDIADAPIGKLLAAKLRLMMDDITWLQHQMEAFKRLPKAEVKNKSFLSVYGRPELAESIDLIVTSPPYLNNYHYPRNTRPQLHWLGYATGRGYQGAREDESFGKFWQTVRCLPAQRLDFRMPELEDVIQEIRSTNTGRGSYGGPGWANYVATYFNDTYRFCRIVSGILREGGVAVIVLGNSILQGIEVRTDHYFGKIAELCQLRFEDTLLLRKKRTGTSIIKSSVRVDKAPQKTELYESAVIIRK
ncbi:MAG: site-specific DNA-methyltransferase, partial [Pyrinomonadaceae bacterium]